MTKENQERSESEDLALPGLVRGALVVVLVLLAVAHLVFPDLAIDPTFLGLLALAAIIAFFDIESVEWLGIRARRVRRELRQATVALDAAPRANEIARPTEPPVALAPGVTANRRGGRYGER